MWIKKVGLFLYLFLPHRLKREVKELYAATLMMNFAESMIGIFVPIYLYTIGFSLEKILLFYIAVYAVYFFVVPWGGRIACTKGYEHAILYGTIFLVLYYISLYYIPQSNIFIVAAVVSLILQKSLYWPGYHADFAHFAADGERGQEISNLNVLNALLKILAPVLGGFILTFFSFKVLFLVVSILILASNIPTFNTLEKFKPLSFSYKHAFSRIFKRENYREFLAYLGYGEEFLMLLIWPVFIYLVVKEYLAISLIVAAAIFVTSLYSLYVGRLCTRDKQHRVVKLGSILSSLSWLLRIGSSTPLAIFGLETFHGLAKSTLHIPLLAITYRRASRGGVMERIILFEMGLILGKLIAAVLCLVLLYFFGFSWSAIFVVGAVMSLFYMLL